MSNANITCYELCLWDDAWVSHQRSGIMGNMHSNRQTMNQEPTAKCSQRDQDDWWSDTINWGLTIWWNGTCTSIICTSGWVPAANSCRLRTVVCHQQWSTGNIILWSTGNIILATHGVSLDLSLCLVPRAGDNWVWGRVSAEPILCLSTNGKYETTLYRGPDFLNYYDIIRTHNNEWQHYKAAI